MTNQKYKVRKLSRKIFEKRNQNEKKLLKTHRHKLCNR